MCLDDVYMYECINGHCYCEGHNVEVDPEELRKDVITHMAGSVSKMKKDPEYIKECEKELIKIAGMPRDQLIEEYSSADGEDSRCKHTPLACPICQYKKATNVDSLIALKKEYGLNEKEILEIVKKHIKY